MATDPKPALMKAFYQKTGPRAGQKFKLKRSPSGLLMRVYASGDTALTASARQQLAGPGQAPLTGRAAQTAARAYRKQNT